MGVATTTSCACWYAVSTNLNGGRCSRHPVRMSAVAIEKQEAAAGAHAEEAELAADTGETAILQSWPLRFT